MKRLFFALLVAAVVAVPRSSHGQAVKGMTLDQYLLMQERVDAFCSFYVDQVNGAKPWPSYSAGVRIPTGAGLYYVYGPEEVQALMKHCRNLIRLLQQVRQ